MLIRRLLMLVAVLLGLTVIVAAIAPRPEPNDPGGQSAPPPSAQQEERGGEPQRAEPGQAEGERTDGPAREPEPAGTPPPALAAIGVDAQYRLSPAGEPDRRLRARVGETLRLIVSADRRTTVEIPALAVFEAIDDVTPARLELRMERPGRFPIRLGDGTQLALLDVKR